MRWRRVVQLVDIHCEGENGRVVTGGVLNAPGDTMAAKLDHINQSHPRIGGHTTRFRA